MGLIAGSGELPLHFARQAGKKGYRLVTVGIRESASRRLEPLSGEIIWISSGQLGALLSFFKKHRVTKAVMLGKIQHSQHFKNLKLDWKALSIWAGLKNRSGEALLGAVAGELAKNGTKVLDSRTWMDGLLVKRGWLTGEKPGLKSSPEISKGLKLASALASAGVGQSIAVKKGAVVSVEGMEGTNETILRAGKWAGSGTILIKVPSPRQDWRFDVPTIGLKTIQALVKAGAKGLVVKAGKVFFLEQEKAKAMAEKNGLFILGV
jgi:DUF1009 family protein